MKKQSGFTLVEGLLIVLVVVAIGFTGYYVWNQQNKNDQTNNSVEKTQEQKASDNEQEVQQPEEESISKNWKRYDSGQGAFSIKIADGLDGLRDTSTDFFIFRTYTSSSTPAVVEDVDGYGGDGFSALVMYTTDKNNVYIPSERLNLKTEKFVTNSGLEGTKESYEDPYQPPCEGPGCYIGDLHVVYSFENMKTNKVTQIWYGRRVANDESIKVNRITQDDPDYTVNIDAMVKSLEFNN